jgi:hypothetical protein
LKPNPRTDRNLLVPDATPRPARGILASLLFGRRLRPFNHLQNPLRTRQNSTAGSGREPRSQDLSRHLYASVLAQGCNIGLTRMAQISERAYDRTSDEITLDEVERIFQKMPLEGRCISS